jgi:hypothetical protein
MFCLFTEIYWNLDEVILEQYWRVLYNGLKVISVIIISPISFHLTAGKMATAIAHHRNIFKIQKPVDVFS